jgi:hypothetical protein
VSVAAPYVPQGPKGGVAGTPAASTDEGGMGWPSIISTALGGVPTGNMKASDEVIAAGRAAKSLFQST